MNKNKNTNLGKDCCNQDIIPIKDTLSIHTNRHRSTQGNNWGWIEGCSLNICWSNDDYKKFNHKAASDLVKKYNEENI